MTEVVAGTNLRFRIVGLVSPGRNGVVESVFSAATGVLTVNGDDEGELIQGYALLREVYDDTVKRVDRVASAYSTYFQTRYLADPARSAAINYFANTDPAGAVSTSWDQTGAVRSSLSLAMNAQDIGAEVALGLSPAELLTTFGQPIQLDNSSGNVNQPDNPDPARVLPPYSARVISALPGGETLIRTVVGNYN